MSDNAIKLDESYLSLLDMSHIKARNFFLLNESYFNSELPIYINFRNILKSVRRALKKNPNILEKRELYYKSKLVDVNHIIYSNKNGKYDWRPLQFINPFLYVSLTNCITEKENWEFIINKLKEYQSDNNIICCSIPIKSKDKENKNKASQILKWWEDIEQKSIELSLDFDYLYISDISNCYSSIYTHTISWALHGKDNAKSNRNDETLIGNLIDKHLRAMNNGQTNGIPQGSVLMDFIAEIILGYVDSLLGKKISDNYKNDSHKFEYKILRYRDDYRIFVNNPQDGERILKWLTEQLMDLGLKLHTTKTISSSYVIRDSIKEDKLAWNNTVTYENKIRYQLIQIYLHSLKYVNAGSLCKPLIEIEDHLKLILKKYEKSSSFVIREIKPLISIVVDIAYRNPRVIPICFSILATLFKIINDVDIMRPIINKISEKFSKLPNSGLLDLWLQRLTITKLDEIKYIEPLCILVHESYKKILDNQHQIDKIAIWNNDWIRNKEIKNSADPSLIIQVDVLKDLPDIFADSEIKIFKKKSYNNLFY